MSGIVVTIGYILLVPSILGILLGIGLIFATGSAVGSSNEALQSSAQSQLEESGVPEEIAERVISGDDLTQSQRRQLKDDQIAAIESARMTMSASKVGTGIGATLLGGVSVAVIVVSLLGGLLGWLLTMKKKVLQCSNCGAVTPAS